MVRTDYSNSDNGNRDGIDGLIVQAASLGVITNHITTKRVRRAGIAVGISSANSIGIEFVGTYHILPNGKYLKDSDKPNGSRVNWDIATQAQIDASVRLIKFLMNQYKLSPSDIYWHDEIQQKTGGEGKDIYDRIIGQL